MKQVRGNRIAWAALALALSLPFLALADLSDTKTLTATTSLNLDTGATAGSGGDILWSGTSLTPQGTAKATVLPGVTGATSFGSLDQSTVQVFTVLASASPIPSSTLTAGTIVGVITNGGHTAKVLVTTNGSGSITLQFVTFGVSGGGGGGGGPTVTSVANNSSDIPAGFPNSGIAQGSLFVVKGSGLSAPADPILQDSTKILPFTLNGASVNVTVGGVTKQAALYYAIPTQIAGVLPSSTPTGAGTLTVTYNGVTSAAFNIQVVAAAPGITVYNGSGIAQHALLGTLVTYTDSAKPGEILILWGTGFGATANSDTTYDASANQTSVGYTIYIGGVAATVNYKGASVYPGVDVFAVTIPATSPTGCYVPIAAVANGNVVSNTVTIPIATNGGTCSDPQLGINGAQISGSGAFKSGFLIVSQSTAPSVGVTNSAIGFFQQTSGVSTPGGGGVVSVGACILTQTLTGGPIPTVTALNAGTITVTGPGQSPVTLTSIPQVPGFYSGTLPAIPSTGGAYVFNATAGSGSGAVGAFTATVNFPNPLMTWTNQGAAASVSRAQGLPVTWSGGTPGSFVIISGSSVSGTVSGTFTCYAPQSALQFTVPSYILLGMPAGTGSTSVTNSTNLTSFSASGLDFGGALGNVAISVNSNYN